MNPWICPKCNRVYAPFICECKNCNDKINEISYVGVQNSICGKESKVREMKEESNDEKI